MVIARHAGGRLDIIDRRREMVRLGGGVVCGNRIEAETAGRALACLEDFGRRLRELGARRVRAVGTNTLRRARKDRQFLARAEQALGHPIDIIPGLEEARLVYLGAAHSESAQTGRRLVVDIGGGSTELAIGEGLTATHMHSLYIGCIGMSAEYFDSSLTADGFSRARAAALAELEPVSTGFRELGWRQALGTSGTIRATADILRAMDCADGDITPARLTAIEARMTAAGSLERLALPGLTADREPVYSGGLAILQAVCEGLGVKQLTASEGAMREGVLHDLLARS
ncbi:MAG: hypothetical protein ACREVN_11290 [Gammaproteobacteria bacterium]